MRPRFFCRASAGWQRWRLLSVFVGIGMVSLLPVMASRQQPVHRWSWPMAPLRWARSRCALMLARPLHLLAESATSPVRFGHMLREVWGFGFIQLSGLLSANLAGWWITALVARGDSTLVQMGFFAIASQLRNLTGVVPALLTEGSYATIAAPDEAGMGTPQRVMALCTFASTAVAFFLASLGIILAPWALHAMYGPRFSAASVAASIGMSVAVLQMGNAPPSARVSVVSIRTVAAINTFWAVLTALGGTLLMLHWGGAAGAMAVFFGAHVISAILTFLVLARRDYSARRAHSNVCRNYSGGRHAFCAGDCARASLRACPQSFRVDACLGRPLLRRSLLDGQKARLAVFTRQTSVFGCFGPLAIRCRSSSGGRLKKS